MGSIVMNKGNLLSSIEVHRIRGNLLVSEAYAASSINLTC